MPTVAEASVATKARKIDKANRVASGVATYNPNSVQGRAPATSSMSPVVDQNLQLQVGETPEQYQARVATYQASQKTPSGTLTADISNPKSLNKMQPAPAVITSDAAERDLARKQEQLNILNQDVENQRTLQVAPNQVPQQPQQEASEGTSSQKTPLTLDEQINELLGGLNEGTDAISEGAAEQLGPLAEEQRKVEIERDKQAAISLKRLNQIASGTYPLSPAEQSLLDSTKQSFLSTIEAQKTANQGYQGQLAEAMASLGINMSAPTQAAGQMYAAISNGNAKIADLNAQMATSLAELQLGFQENDYQMVADAWDKTAAHFKDRIDTLKEMQDAISTAAKDEKKELRERTEFAVQTMVESAKFSYQQKQDAIENAFRAHEISEQKRRNLQQEALEWSKITPPSAANAAGGANPVAVDGSDINQTIADITASNKIEAGTRTNVSNALGVINSAIDLAKANEGGEFAGINPVTGIIDHGVFGIPLPFRDVVKTDKQIRNEGYIDAMNLKVQQWASGASLSETQTRQVERFVPKPSDTDATVRSKLNNLVDFMNTQIKSTLAVDNGIKYEPVKVDLFSKSRSLDDIFEDDTPYEQ